MTDPAQSASAPRPVRSIVVALGSSVLFFVLGTLMATLFAVGLAFIFGPAGKPLSMLNQPGPAAILLQAFAALGGFGVATWAIGMKGNRLTLADLRWQVIQPRVAGVAVGLVVGGVAAGMTLVLAFGFGGARLTPDSGTFADYLRQVFLTVVVLAPAALSEEVVFRGVPLVLLARPLGRRNAVLLTSVLFAMAHLLNPGVQPLALVNIGLAGLFLGAAFYLPGGIWTAFGLHLAWNATLASTDAPVSGLPFTIPWINYSPGGPDWLTGAGFGPEGGVVATIVLVLGLIWAGKRTAREGT